jgi:hypothetical protein
LRMEWKFLFQHASIASFNILSPGKKLSYPDVYQFIFRD